MGQEKFNANHFSKKHIRKLSYIPSYSGEQDRNYSFILRYISNSKNKTRSKNEIRDALISHVQQKEKGLKGLVSQDSYYAKFFSGGIEQIEQNKGGFDTFFLNHPLFNLKKGGLIEKPRHGFWKITSLGEDTLKDNPMKIVEEYILKNKL